MKPKYGFTGGYVAHWLRAAFRIEALQSFGSVKKGDVGGFIARPENLSQTGLCWLYDRAVVCDQANVSQNAELHDDAFVCDHVRISGNAIARDNARVRSFARISGYVLLHEKANVGGYADLTGRVTVGGQFWDDTQRLGYNVPEEFDLLRHEDMLKIVERSPCFRRHQRVAFEPSGAIINVPEPR